MAKAPRPGSAGTSSGDEKVTAASQTVTMTVRHPDRGEITRSLNIGSVPFGERVAVRKVTGLPFEAFMAGETAVGLDTLQVWWWLAKRTEDPLASIDSACAEWPEAVTADAFTVEIATPEADDPEA